VQWRSFFNFRSRPVNCCGKYIGLRETMHEENDDGVGAPERLIALQRLRMQQASIHLGSLVPTQFAARQPTQRFSRMLEDLSKLERLRGTSRREPDHRLRVH
jgi:hypothetical protein